MKLLSGSLTYLLTVNLQVFVPSQTPIEAFDVKKQFKNGPYNITHGHIRGTRSFN